MKRTTVEIDQALLARAKAALGGGTTRATIDTALRLAAGGEETRQAERAQLQRDYFANLESWADLDVLRSDEMWR